MLCSSDPEYPDLAAAVLAAQKARGSNVPVLVAGNPETTEELRAKGIADFIHLRSNPIEVLSGWQQRLGIGV